MVNSRREDQRPIRVHQRPIPPAITHPHKYIAGLLQRLLRESYPHCVVSLMEGAMSCMAASLVVYIAMRYQRESIGRYIRATQGQD